VKAGQPTSGRLDKAAFGGLLLLLLWLPLPWGSHRPWASHLFVLLAGFLLALAGAGLAAERRPVPRHLYTAGGLWLAWLLWIALQLLPLPPAWLQALSPASAVIHAAAGRATGAAPLETISVAPGQGVDSLLLSLGYFALYLLAALTVRDRGRRRAAMLALVIAGLLQAVYGSLMTLSGEEYGFLSRKVYYLGYATGTFVNRNHLAAYLGLTAAVGLGLMLADLGPASEARGWRARLASLVELALSTKLRVRVAIAMMVIGLVLTRSRMGNTAFFVALGVVGLAQVLLRERRLLLRAVLLFGSLVVIDTLIVSHWFGLGKVVERIETTEVQTEMRTQVWQRLPPVVEAYAATGSGLGSFAVAFPPFRTPDIAEYYDHAHDDYLEFLIETGVPGLALMALLVLSHVLHALQVARRRHDRLLQGLAFSFLMASLALAVHASVEFNFQIPAIAATYVALMGIVAACSAKPQTRGLAAEVDVGAEPPDSQASSQLSSDILRDSV
jgi:O-antigen ligase